MKKLSILGSTGSIGQQALEVAKVHNIPIKALAAHSNVALLESQSREFKAEYVCIYDSALFSDLKLRLRDTSAKILCGMDGLCEIAALTSADLLLNAVVGMVGLLPTLTALQNNIPVALANKETLVAGGKLVMELAAQRNVPIYPVDSEHSAIFQCLQGNNKKEVNKVILTASGGPFFGKSQAELACVKLEQALNHPNWQMGRKITVDSATLMNKGLEFIEAKWLFDLEPSQIEIVVHRQSILHSAVEYKDFSIIGQLGVPDMKIPIQYALLYPKRMACPTKRLSLTDYGTLTFEKPDYDTFACLSACIRAIEKGGAYPCIINAANEVAVQHFLDGKISFLQIGQRVVDALEHFPYKELKNYNDVAEADAQSREFTLSRI